MDSRAERLITLGVTIVELRRALNEKKTELQAAEAELRRLMSGATDSASSTDAVSTSAGASSLAERVREYFRVTPGVRVRAEDLAVKLELSSEQVPTLRSTLSRLGKSGTLVAHGRGLYGTPAPGQSATPAVNGTNGAGGLTLLNV